ncbi:hypothetical protein DID88_000856 [Monilinia fructigena]|uniref:PXA domain-containing protein n=1 Tax=Monilinia fructigena TaxID=38457 RepID=A0A395IZP6_9HELO|nr:hypothetical protein DID88_000856 [Monilinia fructigena]
MVSFPLAVFDLGPQVMTTLRYDIPIPVAEGATEDDIMTRTFRFLSTASNEQLILIALTMAFSIYIVLDGLLLLLLGALIGIGLGTTWTGKSPLTAPDCLVKDSEISEDELIRSLIFVTNSSSITIVFLNELANATSATPGTNRPAGDMITTYLTANPNSNLANIMNEKQQMKKFKLAADDILQSFLEKSVYESGPARIFLREILAGVVLEMTLKSCSKPEFINGWIVYLLEDGEPGLGQAIDQAMDRRNIHDPFSDIDGNVGNISLARPFKRQGHQRRISDEEATKEAVAEAKRLSMLIAEEDAKRLAEIGNAKNEESKITDDENTKENIQPESTPSTNGTPPHTPITDSTPATSGSPESRQPISPATPKSTPPSRALIKSSLTLHNANIIIYDDSVASDKGRIKSRPTIDYMVQIEPESSMHPGWMIVRRYPDFETLHEVLGRIAKVSGATAFIEQHIDLPDWKTHTKPSLRGELERYLKDALIHQPLAESEGMKRFLEKDQGTMPAPASKGAAAGVSGVFSNIGSLAQKRSSRSSFQSQNRFSTPAVSRVDSTNSSSGSFFELKRGRLSEDSLKAASVVSLPGKTISLGRNMSRGSIPGAVEESGIRTRGSSVSSQRSAAYSPSHSQEPSQTPSTKCTPFSSPTMKESLELRLPPPPTEMPDDYISPIERSPYQVLGENSETPRTSTSTASSSLSEQQPLHIKNFLKWQSEKLQFVVSEVPAVPATSTAPKAPLVPEVPEIPEIQPVTKKAKKEAAPLSEEETKVAVELLFAVITELYTLSGAWNIRRTLLTAAKTFLLRPGNPSLSSIQELMQDSVIAAYTSDEGIASSLRKLREKCFAYRNRIEELACGDECRRQGEN